MENTFNVSKIILETSLTATKNGLDLVTSDVSLCVL